MKEEIVAIIPARAGSKGIKNKNIINFCGKPLIAWSIEQALNSKNIKEVFVSTDGEDIAEISGRYGAKIIRRPEALASDSATSEDAIIHAMNQIEQERKVDIVVFLQATSPIRLTEDIDGAIIAFIQNNMDSLFSMTVLDDYCLWKKTENELRSWSFDYEKRGRRQEREKLYLENGSIYLFRPDIIRKCNNRLGGNIGMYEMPFERSYEIDSYSDIPICEFFMKRTLEENK